jgi:exonuclease SbcC
VKPRKLRIKGLNSFIEEQEIDFERLTEKGMFGIFGPTGSGKSTILDAMTLALYGTISRDTREYMNALSSSLSVSYEFEIGIAGERKIYIADRIVNKDKNGAYKLKTSRLREINGEEDIPIAEGANEVKNMVETVLGLTGDDFTRSVVLPQGKFNEFLKLSGRDRRNMLERIFRLESFGRNLGDKIRAVRKEKNDNLNLLLGRIRSYEEQGVSKEKYSLLKAEIKLLNEEEKNLKSEKLKLDEAYEKYKVIWSLQEELQVYKNRDLELKSKFTHIEGLREKLKLGQRAAAVKPYIDNVMGIEEKLKINEADINKFILELKNIETKLATTELNHKEWLEKKEKQVPILIEKESKLNRALELQSKINLLEKERAVLLEQYKKGQKDLQGLRDKVDLILKSREEANVEKTSLEKRLEEINISPEYREQLQRAFRLEEDFSSYKKDLEEVKRQINQRSVSLDNLNKSLDNLQKSQNICYKEIAVTEEKIQALSTNNPGDNKLLMDKRSNIFSLEATIKEVESHLSKNKELTEALKGISFEKEELEKVISSIKMNIEEKRMLLNDIENEIKKVERESLASILAAELLEGEACPVCGSTHHPEIAEESLHVAISDKKEQRDQLEKHMKVEEDNLREKEVAFASSSRNEAYFISELTTIEEKLQGKDIEALNAEKASLEQEFNSLNKAIEEWNKDKENNEKALNKKKDEKSTIDKDEVKFSENIKAEKAFLVKLQEENNSLEGKSSAVTEELLGLKKALKLENIKEEVNKIREFDREIITIQKKLKDLAQKINQDDLNREEVLKGVNNVELELARIQESGKEKRSVIDREKLELAVLSEGRNPEEYISEVKALKAEIIQKEELLKNAVNNEKEANQRASDALLSENTNKEALNSQKREWEEKLGAALTEWEFHSTEEALSAVISKEIMTSMDKEIAEYDDKLKDINANISRVTNKLKDESIDSESWKAIQEDRIKVTESLEASIREMSKKSQSLKELEKNLEELNVLYTSKKELEHLCSNLEDLAKLVEGNKFVEFVAMSQLKYISIEASKRLKDITRGRYALEIDSSGNFIMRDDFNGGARRATNTLSGGETFLTSLSLALSLSSQIQLKGSAPLEFFFLDEGFGTLDSDLLETVMQSLERLHSSKLCVGIISHVEELKSRVPVKLLVEPAEQGKHGSKVRIELS